MTMPMPDRLMRVLVLVMLAACNAAEPTPRTLALIDAPGAGDIEPIVAGELGRAFAVHDQLLVYVGASWCEPCRDFHDAAEKGELDRDLGGVRLLVFDADRDTDALESAGYHSEYIPLFAVPRLDGRASGKQIEGAVKGRDAVAQIVPRLQALLAR